MNPAPPLPERLRIGALARHTGLSPDSLRHYERLGLLAPPARTEGGFREYPASAVRRVRVIQAALTLGFTLEELSGVFRERAAGRAPCRGVRALAGQKLQALEAQLQQLLRLRRTLRRTLREWDERLAGAPTGTRVGLLEALASSLPREAVDTRPCLQPPPRRRRPRG